MKWTLTSVLRALFCLLVWFVWSAAAQSQSKGLDDCASQIDHELKPIKPHLVAVVDFQLTGNADNVLGHYENNAYLLHVTPVVVSTKEFLPSLTARIHASDFLDRMGTPLPTDVPLLVTKTLAAEFNMPSCVHCPDPSYNDTARQAKVNGSNVFQVVISLDGQAALIRPSNSLVTDSTKKHMPRLRNGNSSQLPGKRTERPLS